MLPPSPLIEDQTESVVTTAEQTSPQEPPQPLPSDLSPPISEVNPESRTKNISSVVTNSAEGEDNTVDSDTGKYILPYRSTRGIPPKRYSPEKIGAKSRYGVANFVQGNLTKMARAFEAALYEEGEIPQTAEEAMKYKHWREAMFTEMRALMKNNT